MLCSCYSIVVRGGGFATAVVFVKVVAVLMSGFDIFFLFLFIGPSVTNYWHLDRVAVNCSSIKESTGSS